jgi:uncharacterized phage-associated protein
MLTANDVAKYFLSKDPNRKLFNNNIVVKNSRKFYEGNARLNKYLFLSQVVYLAKYSKKLFEDDFIAYENGPVIKEVMKNYSQLSFKDEQIVISEKERIFLDKIYYALEQATYDDLIEITHEDPEWIELSKNTYNAPVMDLEKHIAEYKIRYKGIIEALNI